MRASTLAARIREADPEIGALITSTAEADDYVDAEVAFCGGSVHVQITGSRSFCVVSRAADGRFFFKPERTMLGHLLVDIRHACAVFT